MVVNAPLLGTSGGAIRAPNLRSQTIPNVADGAYRFHWSVIPSEESLPIAAGRTGGLARARSMAEEALRAYAADFRMQTEITSANSPSVDAQAES